MSTNNGRDEPGRRPPIDSEDAIRRLLELAGPRPQVPPERAERVRAAVHAEWRASVNARNESERRERLARWRLPAIGLAAAVTLTIAAVLGTQALRTPADVATVQQMTGTVSLETNGRTLRTGKVLVAGSRLRTGSSGGVRLAMSSGHALFVAAGTTVELSASDRLQLTAGAVYLESGRGGADSVSVETAFGQARDIGTRFEVRTLEGGMRVRVREGQVALREIGYFGDDIAVADAGEQLLVNEIGRVERQPLPDKGDEWTWLGELREPFELEGSTLAGFLEWVTLENGWELRYSGIDVQRFADTNTLHGDLADLQGEQAVAAILQTVGLGWRLEDRILTVGATAK